MATKESAYSLIQSRGWKLRSRTQDSVNQYDTGGIVKMLVELDLCLLYDLRSSKWFLIDGQNPDDMTPQTPIYPITEAHISLLFSKFSSGQLTRFWKDSSYKAEVKGKIVTKIRMDNFAPTHARQMKMVESLTAHHKYVFDSYKVALDKLPEWDGVERLDSLIEDCFSVELPQDVDAEDAKKYVRSCSAMLIMGAIMRTMQPGCDLSTTLVLAGDQGIGKSVLAKLLVLPYRGMNQRESSLLAVASDVPLGLGSKRYIEKTAGKVFVEHAEIKIGSNTPISAIKESLTRTTDSDRMAYGYLSVDMLRRHIPYITLNPSTGSGLPKEPDGGYRRYAPVMLGQHVTEDDDEARQSRDLVYDHIRKLMETEVGDHTYREMLWAEGLVRYNEYMAGGQENDNLVRMVPASHEGVHMVFVNQIIKVAAEPELVITEVEKRTFIKKLIESDICSQHKRHDDSEIYFIRSKSLTRKQSKLLKSLGWFSNVQWHDGKSVRGWACLVGVANSFIVGEEEEPVFKIVGD